MNKLYYGDCLMVMREKMKKSSVDLIYLDPPFNSKKNYNAIYKTETGLPLPDQIEAFCDMWTLDEERERAIREMPITMETHGIDTRVIQFWETWVVALRGIQPKLLAYLSYMVERLLQMRIVLKPTGSIYLHCDPTCGHYLKVMMDSVFGHNNFRNEIVWCYKRMASSKQKVFSRTHDTMLFYSKTPSYTLNVDAVRLPYASSSKKRAGYAKTSLGGAAPKSGVCELNKNGRFPEDWWEIPIIRPNANERLGYPTQKPIALLDRIIKASSNEGDVVFDPFCGCGTTIDAAHTLNRKWIGCDVAYHAINRVSKIRLRDRCHLEAGRDYEITGLPLDEATAYEMWKRDPYHFQKWAVEYIDGFAPARRSSDGGIDGRIYFEVEKPDLNKELKGATLFILTTCVHFMAPWNSIK